MSTIGFRMVGSGAALLLGLVLPLASAESASAVLSPDIQSACHQSSYSDLLLGPESVWEDFYDFVWVLPPGVVRQNVACETINGGTAIVIYFKDPVGVFRQAVRGLAAQKSNTFSPTPTGSQRADNLERLSLSQAENYSEDQLEHDRHEFVHFTLPPGGDTHTIDLDLWANASGAGYPSLVMDLHAGDYQRIPRTGAADEPSFLSQLKTVWTAVPSATQATATGAGAVALSLVISYPAILLDRVIGNRYEQVRDWLRRRRKHREPSDRSDPTRRRLPHWLLWPGFVAAGIIGALNDPQFGFNSASLRTVASLTLSFLVFNIAAWGLTRLVLGRLEPENRARIDLRIGSVALLALTVLLSRLLDFNPGVVFGTLAGLVYATRLGASKRAAVILTGSGFAAIVAIAAWLLYSLVTGIPGEANNSVLLFVGEFLAGVVISGVAAAPLSLLPLTTLDGGALFRWHRWVWFVAYAVGLALFALTMFTIPQSFQAISGDLVRWFLLFVAFAALALAVWFIDGKITRRKRTTAQPEKMTAGGG